MSRTNYCSQLVALTMTFCLYSSAQASIVEVLIANPDATNADLAQSFVEYDECLLQGTSQQQCYKILWDPPAYITEGVMTVDITSLDGDTSRVGNVIRVTFFNGYTGNGPFQRFDLPDRVRFEIPVISVEPPPETDNLDIVELQVADNGTGQDLFNFTFDANNVLVNPNDPDLPPELPATVTPKTELLGFQIPLTTAQEVPPPDVTGFEPSGNATISIDPNALEVKVKGTFAGMTSEVVGAHLHGPAEPGETAPVIFGFNEIAGTTEGTFFGTAEVTPEQLDYVLSGLTYINVHTELNQPGEIRGQIVPEPSSASLMLLGMMAFGLVRRRR